MSEHGFDEGWATTGQQLAVSLENAETASERLTVRLDDLETAATIAAETIDQQRRDIIELRGIIAKRNAQLGKVRENITNLFTLADRVEIPTILIRDFCEKCGHRYLVGKVDFCQMCGPQNADRFQRNVSCPFDQPLADLISEDITPDAFASLIADVAIGVSVITKGEGDTLRIVAKEGRS